MIFTYCAIAAANRYGKARAVPPPLGVPVYAGGNLDIIGSRTAGATLTAPTVSWTNSPTSISRQWWKNGNLTDTIDVSTFSLTVDGDVVEYEERANNAAGTSIYNTRKPFLVSGSAQLRASGATTEMSALISGKTGGVGTMKLFNSDPGSSGCTRNSSLWCSSLVSQLASCVAWKSGSSSVMSYGGVLVGDGRHVLYCNHAHPSANQGSGVGQTLRWILPDNTVVEAIQICESNQSATADPGYVSVTGGYVDLCVATLDRNVASLGVPIAPIMAVANGLEYAALFAAGLPSIGVSQGAGRATGTIPPTPISDYTNPNVAMAYINTQESDTARAPFTDFDYEVWDGDSGSPRFALANGILYLDRIILFSGSGGICPGQNIPAINQLLAASDAGAVALGRLIAPTGVVITATSLPVS